jgi:hypothetical protein
MYKLTGLLAGMLIGVLTGLALSITLIAAVHQYLVHRWRADSVRRRTDSVQPGRVPSTPADVTPNVTIHE